MNVLLIGSGGREHALALALSRSPGLGALHAAPGNPGIAACATCAALDPEDHTAVIAYCGEHQIELVVVGPEAPLAGGLVDSLSDAGIAAFGPTKAAAQLESSKEFTKALCAEHGIPTAGYAVFDDPKAAIAHCEAGEAPFVIKADGLAAGKGVTIADDLNMARVAIEDALGEPGAKIVIEDFLVGEEVSLFALCDGERAVFLGDAQDHKRAYDRDTGPNTGGMGAFSPSGLLSPDDVAGIMERIIAPTLSAMTARGTPFRGILYAGLMLTEKGPSLIEYNVRFGDPECQVILARLTDDLLPLLHMAARGALPDDATVTFRRETSLIVVLANRGYPGVYDKGAPIDGLDRLSNERDVTVFHAGTAQQAGTLVATGGRVLGVTTLGGSVREAQARAYAAVDELDWRAGFCRLDIGWRGVEREIGATASRGAS
ncbi:MAG: phosphoribosylamine--glycine ligase [Pseudomonadota bacterium]